MKITNNEYSLIINSLESKKESKTIFALEIGNLISRLKKEYNEIAERNLAEGMSKEEEEVYPSRLYSEYGGEPIGDQEVE
jgi:Golgi nucleoside diphosphatase